MNFSKDDMIIGRDIVNKIDVQDFASDISDELNISMSDSLRIVTVIKGAVGTARAPILYSMAANASGFRYHAAMWALTWLPDLASKYLKQHNYNYSSFFMGLENVLNSQKNYSRDSVLSNYTFRSVQYWRDKMNNGLRKLKEKPSVLVDNAITNGRFRTAPPRAWGQWVSVEIECYIPFSELRPLITDEDRTSAKAGSYGDRCPERECIRRLLVEAGVLRFDVKHDGSIHSGSMQAFPLEITASINREAGYSNLKRLCDVLSGLKARVNSTCGLHVHVDMRGAVISDADKRRVSSRYRSALPFLLSMQHESRRNNRYCRPKLNKWTRSRHRHVAINLMAFQEHKTVEVRLHSGTTNFEKIKNWCELVYRIGRGDYQGVFKNFQDFIDKLQLDENLIEYIERRQALFNGKDYLEKCETMGEWVDSDNDDVVKLFKEKKQILEYREKLEGLVSGVGACIDFNNLVTYREVLNMLLNNTRSNQNFADTYSQASNLMQKIDSTIWAALVSGESINDVSHFYDRMDANEAKEAFKHYAEFKAKQVTTNNFKVV